MTQELDSERARLRGRAVRRSRLISLIPLAACLLLGGLYLLLAWQNGYDLGIGMAVVVSNATFVALVATGATFIFTAGSFDLSLGANMLVSALVGGLVGRASGNLFLMLLATMGTAISLSVLGALLATFFNLPVFIMTIVMMNVYSAVSTLMLTTLGTNAALAVPTSLVTGLNQTWFRLLLLAAFDCLPACCFICFRWGGRRGFSAGIRFAQGSRVSDPSR